jgi:serine/threonine protein kinase
MYRDYGPIDESMTRIVTRQILNALKFTHENNIIHGDIKAANILFDGERCKLSDFGEAYAFENNGEFFTADESRFDVAQITGSLLWMAPEIFKEQPRGRRSDIWSLGCTIIELLTA